MKLASMLALLCARPPPLHCTPFHTPAGPHGRCESGALLARRQVARLRWPGRAYQGVPPTFFFLLFLFLCERCLCLQVAYGFVVRAYGE